MLDTTTKRRIDSCRDMLVGRVPDPKSQVELITIALIYKFMDDMDAEAEELGGHRSFFAGDYAKYGWAKLLAPAVGGQEMLNLFGEAIAKMPDNPGVPALFRSIFKNAYLPFRDPETLRSFLKEINGFTYDHSERLGDAFEYLLSVLGSQGDAGQFRTPRHIIDFIVSVVDPQKNETVLDPACGTAGFLISSYKHILAANTQARPGDRLTSDERAGLARNFTGYDISPDMVRLSLVNLYLHGFPLPQIEEYDTLTSDDRWNEHADVILANPPFMSPKGGIQPHKRFGVQSSRSEVLFVDYIAEHLTPNGRAGVIVPEGIIFQSGAAYKALRKMLVEKHLVAVVSLPAGVFQPYSAVKTSILVLDKSLAKTSDAILFAKIEQDGRDLGATRRATKINDLPAVEALLLSWRDSLREGNPFEPSPEQKAAGAALVPKSSISATGDYNLSGSRYSSKLKLSQSEWPHVALADILEPSGGGKIAAQVDAPVMSITMKHGLIDQSDKFKKRIASADISGYKKVRRNELVVGFPIDEGVLGFQTKYDVAAVSPAYDVWKLKSDKHDLKFLEMLLRSGQARTIYLSMMRGTANRRRTIDKADFLRVTFPLPPLAVQQEIVAEIAGYQKVIDGARQVVENYTPRIDVRPEWPMVELGEAAEVIMGQSPDGESYNLTGEGMPLINGPVEFGPDAFSKTIKRQYTTTPTKLCKEGDLILCVRGATTGRMNIAGFDGCIGRGVAAIRSSHSQGWINQVINSMRLQILGMGSGSTFPNVSKDVLCKILIPSPDLETQRAIVAEIEAEQRLVDGNKELAARFEAKIQTAIGRVWGDGG